jgi:hypothetical protein
VILAIGNEPSIVFSVFPNASASGEVPLHHRIPLTVRLQKLVALAGASKKLCEIFHELGAVDWVVKFL